ncbi:Uncharacterised protein [Prevotella nigrescens]|nr:Uncharacterised protein [Prevotella nigrescens]
MKNNRHHSENQAQHLPLRPDTGGTAGIENSSTEQSLLLPAGYTLGGGRTRNLLCL